MLDGISVFCLNWHLDSSPAAYKLIAEPLRRFAKVELLGEFNEVTMSRRRTDGQNPLIFFQLPPPDNLLADPKAKLIWVPMWDSVEGLPQTWWNSLPRHLRIVAFSDVVAKYATEARLPVLHLQYFIDPASMPLATWSQGRVMFYWNRIGLLPPQFLETLCHTLRIDKLLFRGKLDPGRSPNLSYRLPERLGNTVVESIDGISDRDAYLEQLKLVNIYVAPRPAEGVGMTFLEALASGCAVFAADAPTMNEYISHKANGYLFGPKYKGDALQNPDQPRRLPVSQQWDEIQGLELMQMAQNARQHHLSGFERWNSRAEEYARFILDW